MRYGRAGRYMEVQEEAVKNEKRREGPTDFG